MPDKSVAICQGISKWEVYCALKKTANIELDDIMEFKGKISLQFTERIFSKEGPNIFAVSAGSPADDFKSAFMSGESSDISLRFQQTDVPCHRFVITARCAYFKYRVASISSSKQSYLNVDLPAVDCSVDDFRASIFYLYAGELPGEDDAITFDPCKVLAISHMLGLPRLKELCELAIARRCGFHKHIQNEHYFVRETLKPAIQAYLVACRYEARQLEEYLVFNLRANAFLVATHIDTTFKGAFGNESTIIGSLDILRRMVSRTSTGGAHQYNEINGYTVSCSSAKRAHSEERADSAIMDTASVRVLAGECKGREMGVVFGQTADADKLRRAVIRLALQGTCQCEDCNHGVHTRRCEDEVQQDILAGNSIQAVKSLSKVLASEREGDEDGTQLSAASGARTQTEAVARELVAGRDSLCMGLPSKREGDEDMHFLPSSASRHVCELPSHSSGSAFTSDGLGGVAKRPPSQYSLFLQSGTSSFSALRALYFLLARSCCIAVIVLPAISGSGTRCAFPEGVQEPSSPSPPLLPPSLPPTSTLSVPHVHRLRASRVRAVGRACSPQGRSPRPRPQGGPLPCRRGLEAPPVGRSGGSSRGHPAAAGLGMSGASGPGGAARAGLGEAAAVTLQLVYQGR